MTAQQRGNQIRERFAGARTGFREQCAAALDHAGDGFGHPPLSLARLVTVDATGERSAVIEKRPRGIPNHSPQCKRLPRHASRIAAHGAAPVLTCVSENSDPVFQKMTARLVTIRFWARGAAGSRQLARVSSKD